jgi:hypothetical protein
MSATTKYELNRHGRRHPDELPDWMTKKQVAEWLQCSQRQVELLTASGRLSKPIYLGASSPRWNKAALLACLGQSEGTDA